MKAVVFALGCSLVALCGCADRQAIEARRAALDAREDTQCRSYGAKPGSDAYFHCRMTLNTQRQQAEQHADDIAASASAGMMQAGAGMMRDGFSGR